jgi:two-component system, OmpR family, heavy metal sensor histidine kinase CusS
MNSPPPLAILQGQLEQEIQQAESGSQLQHLGDMLGEVSRLSSILRKLLLLSLADAGRMHLTFSEVNLSPLFDEVVEDIDLQAPELKLDVDVEPNLKIEADPNLLRQVLQNLATNAVKYNLPGGWIRVEAHRGQNQVVVTVTNQSQDLAEEVRDRLFERFYRADLSHSRQMEGVGLGLSLAQEIVRAHQGELRLAATQPGEVGIILVLPKKQFGR